jgi:hypothetical protein
MSGRNQAVAALSSTNVLPGTGGSITSTTSGTLTSTGGGNFGGVLSGSLSFTRSGNNPTLLTSAQTYFGATTIRGGVLQLRDAGALTNSSGINNYFGTLNLDFSNYTTYNSTDRVSDGIPISLYGSWDHAGGDGDNLFRNFGHDHASARLFNSHLYSGTDGAAPLTITNLIRTPGSVVNFTGSGTLGVAGFGNGQINLGSLNSAAVSTGTFLLGGWAFSGSDFVGYSSTLGVGTLGTAAFGNYDSVISNGTLSLGSAQNVKITAAGTLVAGGSLVNSLNIAGAFNLSFANTSDVLNVVSGGLLKSGGASNIGSSGAWGVSLRAGPFRILPVNFF